MNNINNLIAKMPKNELKRALEKERCARSFMEFIKLAWPVIEPANPFQNNWHIEAMSEHLEAVTKGQITRLLVNVPPGASKSTLCSVMFPAWEWTLAPHLRFLTLAHSENLAIRDTVKMRRLVQSDWYQDLWGDKVILRKDQNEKGHFENDATGFRQASPSKALTGKRGDRVICLPYESMIETDCGKIPIGKIVEEQLDVKIKGSGGWQSIEKYEQNPLGKFIKIVSGGREVICTDDHLIYETTKGWIQAKNLAVGDRIIKLSSLWENKIRKEKENCILQQRVLLPGAETYYDSGEHETLLGLREGYLSLPSSLEKVRRPVLLTSMCKRIDDWRKKSSMARWKCCNYVPEMRCGICKKKIRGKESKILHSNVCSKSDVGGKPKEITNEELPVLQCRVQAKAHQDNLLFSKLCGCGAFEKNEGGWKWSLCSRTGGKAIPCWLVEKIQEIYKRVGWKFLSDLQNGCGDTRECASRSSYRLQQGQLGTNESDNIVQILPWENARQGGTADDMEESVVESVEYIQEYGEKTYNIKVAPYHDYFANGILLHNCDDPHSVDGANSAADREAVLRTFSESLPTRLNSPIESAIVVVMQRLHENDVSGFILEKELGYEHLMIPMRFERERKCYTSIGWEDPRTEEGELMFPERFPEEVLQQLEKAMDNSYAIAGQMQQRPTPRGGGIIKREWWQLWDDETAAEFGATKGRYPKFDYVLASFDGAYTSKSENCPSALTIWGIFNDKAGNPKLMLAYAWAERFEFNQLLNRVKADCERFDVDCLIIESKATGLPIAQEMRRILGAGQMRVVLMNPGSGSRNVLGNDKIARAHAVTGMFEDGMIYAPDKVWAEAVILECELFPKGKYADRVDTVTQALQYFRNMGFALTREEIRDIDSADEAEEYSRMRGLIQGKLYDV